MACTQTTTRLLRTFITDLSIPSTANSTRPARRSLARLPRPTIRHTSSSAPRGQQSGELNINITDNNATPDFLGMYTAAKKNPNKEALAVWGSSWKTETDLSAMRDHEIRLPENSHNTSNGSSTTKGEKNEGSYTFLDDFTSLPTAKAANKEPEENNLSFHNTIPESVKRNFPTRSSSSSPEGLSEDGEIPWEDSERISKKMSTPHDPVANAWKEWSTPALWSHARMQELYKPKITPNGIRISKHATLDVNTGHSNWKPSSSSSSSTTNPVYSIDRHRQAAGMALNTEKKVYDKETPAWKIHLDSVKAKIKHERWNPMSRLSPAAVATLKQLKAENPGMTVEEYAPIFKISPDALRRILRSKWTPSPKEETDRMTRWKRRGESVWQQWNEMGLVVERKKKQSEEEKVAAIEKEKEQRGFVVRRGLNLKNRIL